VSPGVLKCMRGCSVEYSVVFGGMELAQLVYYTEGRGVDKYASEKSESVLGPKRVVPRQ